MSLFDELPSTDEMESIYLKVMNKGMSVFADSNYFRIGNLYWNRGCARRLQVLLRCLSNVFTILPYNEEHEYKDLDIGAIEDTNINFNSFIVTYHGYLDDLAFMIEGYLPPTAKHNNPKDVSIRKINWKEAGNSFRELKKLIDDYLKNSEPNDVNRLIRDRSVHRLFPYLAAFINSEEEFIANHRRATQLLMNHDYEGYANYSKMVDQQIQYHGFIVSDCLESGEKSIMIHSIHCTMIDALNDLLDLTINVIKSLTGLEFRKGNSRNPQLINYNWRKQ